MVLFIVRRGFVIERMWGVVMLVFGRRWLWREFDWGSKFMERLGE